MMDYEDIKLQISALAREAPSGKKSKVLAEMQVIIKNIGKIMLGLPKEKRKKLVPIREALLWMKDKRIVDLEVISKLPKKLK